MPSEPSRALPPQALVSGVLLACVVAGTPARSAPSAEPEGRRAIDVWQEGSGLPQNYVFSILQTRDGYLWLGTRGGVARFDGVRFTVFDDRRPDQLRESEVWALAEDADSALWVGTYGGGLTRLKNGVFTTYGEADGLPSAMITALAVTPDGDTWVGTPAGLARRHGESFTTPKPGADVPGGAVRALHVDAHGVLWIGTDQGLASYASQRFVNQTRALPGKLSGSVVAIAGDGQQGLWLALYREGSPDNGVRLLKDGAVTSYTIREGLPSEIAMSVALEADQTVWVGTVGGLCRLRNGRFESYFREVSALGDRSRLERVSLRGIASLRVDREGNIWFGTRYDGVGRLRETPFLLDNGGEAGEEDVDVRALMEDGDSMWLGTAHDLRRLGGTRSERYALQPAGLAADTLARGAKGTLLVGSTNGLFEWARGTIRRTGLPGAESLDISVLYSDSQGTTWIGTRSEGLYRAAAGTLTHYTARDGLLGSQVRAIASDSQGGIWIGTRDGGVSRLRSGRFARFGLQQGLASAAVQAICVDRDDDVWVATRRGLSRIRGEAVATITALQGLPANFFYQIVEGDEGSLWLTYARGIARLAKQELNAIADGERGMLRPVLYGAESGMRSTSMSLPHQPSAWRARNGRIWFATVRGVVVVDPHRSLRNTLPPPVHVEELRAGHLRHEAREGLELDPSESDVEISYTGLSFVAPERVRFRYRLEGLDAHWVEAGTRRTAYYTNLAPGPYRFRVTACNNDGVWNEAGASLAFRVLPRWHQREPVRLLGAAGLLLLALSLHRLRTARLRARERELSARVEDRTQALRQLALQLEGRVSERTAELAAEKERLAVTLRCIGDGVIATDVETRVVLLNRVAEQLTGWTSAEAAGRPLDEVFRTVDRVTRMPLRDPARGAPERGAAVPLPPACLLISRQGQEILVADSAAPIRDPQSQVIGTVIVFRDMTERERMEEQLRSTEKLEALGVLAGGIAHDFNNLLTGIFGLLDVARSQASEPEVRATLDRSRGVLEKARGLTRQLLTFARAGEPIRRPLLLGPLVRDAVGFVLSGSNVVPQVEAAEDLWPCEADEQQLNQVIDNLLLNARQAMPSGGTLSVEIRNQQIMAGELAGLAPGPHVRLSIRDHGPGIPRELRPRIFEPFFTTKPGGSGLGLATVYSIVRRHGGHVAINSEPGMGATFHVYLPACPNERPQAHSPETTPPTADAPARVLVLDDEPYVRDVAREALRSLGYEVLVAPDAEEALRLATEAQARGERIDAAILDLTIPGGAGGRVALERLRGIEPELPGIASSGYTGDPIMARPVEHGFAAALAKPYTLADLGTVVAQVLAERRGR